MPDNIDKVVYPSLGPDNWVFSSMKQADFMMADFLAVDRSQSYVHTKDIFSFGWIIAQYSGDPQELLIETKRVLKIYFERYFDEVTVECYEDTKQTNPNKFRMSIFVEFQMADGKKGNIYQLTEINGSSFEIVRSLTTDNNSQQVSP